MSQLKNPYFSLRQLALPDAWWARLLSFGLLFAIGCVFSFRLTQIPSRLEVSIISLIFFVTPTLIRPKLAIYYLFAIMTFISFFRRLYYLASERPTIDFLMIISDGVMVGLLLAMIMLAVFRQEKLMGNFSRMVFVYMILLFFKIFFLNKGPLIEGLYGFKFNGLYVGIFFAASYLVENIEALSKLLRFYAGVLLIAGLYGMIHITHGVLPFEQRWLDSISFTTIYIEGKIRPFSTFAAPAGFADAMCVLFLFGVYFWFSGQFKQRVFALACFSVSLPGVLFSTVRSNWGALLAALAFWFLLIRVQKKWVKIITLVLMIALSLVYLTRAELDDSPAQNQRHQVDENRTMTEVMIKNRTSALTNPLQEYSLLKRMSIWQEIWSASFKAPLGQGQGMVGYAHSYYFQTLGEIGYPGIILFLMITILGIRTGLRCAKNYLDPHSRLTAELLCTSIFMFALLNLTGSHLNASPGDLYFWFALGAIGLLHKQLQEKNLELSPKMDDTAKSNSLSKALLSKRKLG